MNLADITSLLTQLPALAQMIERTFFLAVCFFLGSFAWKGWRRYHNWGLDIVMTLVLSFVVLSGSILIAQLIPLQLPYVPYAVQALIISVALYVVLRLLSGDAEVLGKYVTAAAFKRMKQEIKELKEDYHRLIKILERKGLAPKKLSADELKDELKDILKEEGIKGEIVNEKISGKSAFFNIRSGINYYEARLDLYTGELLQLKKKNLSFKARVIKLLKLMTSNDRVFAGIISASVLALFLVLLITPSAVSEINSYFLVKSPSSGGENYRIVNESCLYAADLIYVVNNELFTSLENASLPQDVAALLDNDKRVFETSSVTYDGADYLLVALTSMSEEDFGNALQDYLKSNLFSILQGNIDFCSIKHNGRSVGNYFVVCSIKGKQLCECNTLKHVPGACDYYSKELLNRISRELLK